MPRLIYDSADTVVFDPVATNRTATRASLFSLGFRRVEAVATLDALAESIKRRPPDLALCEAQGTMDELCAMVQDLRLGTAGYNPFVVIIVTAWEHNQTLVSRVLNSGADDLVLRPFSTTVLGQRIALHVEKRKGFVITTDYVGPDRRRDSERPSGVELFQPPNSLKMKARDGLTGEQAAQKLDQELKVARDVLNREKLKRDSFQICVLWRLLQVHSDQMRNFSVDLAKLRTIAKGVARRCIGSDFEPAVETCNSVLSALDALEAGVDRSASIHLLGHAALTLNQAFAPEKSQKDHLTAIDATVAIVRAHIQAAERGEERIAAAN